MTGWRGLGLGVTLAWLPACALIDAASTNKDVDDGGLAIDSSGKADAGGGCFGITGICYRPTSISSAVMPRLLAIEDLDTDGWWDVVVAGENGVAVYWGNNAGGIEPSTVLSLATGAYRDLVVGDFDDDPYLDIAVVGDDRTLEVYRNQGGRAFDGALSPTVSLSIERIELIYDASGSDDLLVIPFEGIPFPLISQGDAVFSQGADIGAANGVEAVTVGDFLAEGNPDLAIQRGQTVFRLHGLGDGRFESFNEFDSEMEISTLATLIKPVEGSDWIAVVGSCQACNGAKLVSLRSGGGEEGQFDLPLDVDFAGAATATGHFLSSVEQGLVILNGGMGGDSDVLLLDNIGKRADPAFDAWSLLDSGNPGAVDVAVRDFNGDEIADIVVVGGGEITLLHSQIGE